MPVKSVNKSDIENKIIKQFEKHDVLSCSQVISNFSKDLNERMGLSQEESFEIINSILDNISYKFNDALFIKKVGDERVDSVYNNIFTYR